VPYEPKCTGSIYLAHLIFQKQNSNNNNMSKKEIRDFLMQGTLTGELAKVKEI
jgi:hypothetical protein